MRLLWVVGRLATWGKIFSRNQPRPKGRSLTAAQLLTPSLVFTGVTGAATTIAFGGIVGTYFLDFSGTTLNVAGTTITNGAGSYTATTILGTKTLLMVVCNSTSTIAVG
jgi:hypothetical protein